ncbi:cation diffusion facilitator family transporter [Paenibacillus cremeus]|uniref:Cation transporter n=1 Tax=Paenibacillus cremeus TaxID=2163881 RepID=A0A559K6B6_9BACL|nr:cation diffusion facilitator family transporter [Paenibacillus cremeus]TVY07669.1 cation transporter [Paenibacillus cremeus]
MDNKVNKGHGSDSNPKHDCHDHDHDHDHDHKNHTHTQGHVCDHTHEHNHDDTHDHKHSHDHDHDDVQDHSAHHGHHHHGHHHHGHHHGPGGHHHHGPADGSKRGLTIALLITAGIMLLEFFGGFFTNSLALLSDAGHMLSDTSSLVLSLVAVRFAAKPASAAKTYGFYRFEILAALFNAVTLLLVAVWIIREAYERFQHPPQVAGGSMMLIASIGLIANLASAWSLVRQGDVKNNLNLRSAYLHILGDALGSVGAMAAGLLMIIFQWYWADPLISVLVSLLIVRGAYDVVKHCLNILMEGTPPHIDANEVRQALEQLPGVLDVHDLHIWTISSGLDSLSGHLLIEAEADSQVILKQAVATVERRFRIHHVTIQIEASPDLHKPLKV